MITLGKQLSPSKSPGMRLLYKWIHLGPPTMLLCGPSIPMPLPRDTLCTPHQAGRQATALTPQKTNLAQSSCALHYPMLSPQNTVS